MNTRSLKFCKAINIGNKKRIVNMLKKGQDANAKNVEGIPAIQLAIFRNDLSLVKLLVKYGADINMLSEDNDAYTPLETACYYGKIDIVNYLLSIKCSLDDDSLRIAALMGYSTIVKILIANGADVNRLDAWLSTPIHWAVQESEIDIVKILIENGADINILDGTGQTPLYIAAGENYCDILELLLNNNADIDYTESTSPFMIACAFDNYESAKMLLEHGADINFVDDDGRTALFYAKVRKVDKLVNFLLDNGASTDIVDYTGVSISDLDDDEIRDRLYEELFDF